MNFKFGSYEVITDTRELLHEGIPQNIEPLIFKLLLFMLENPDRVLSRDELIETVWESRIISDSALSASISAARHAIGDAGNKQKCIKTVSGSGYRFIAEFTSDDAEFIDPHYPNTTMKGKDEIHAGLTWGFNGVKSFSFTPINYFENEDGASPSIEYATKIEFPTGKILSYPQVFIIETKNGKISRCQAYETYGPHGMHNIMLIVTRLKNKFLH